MANKNAIIGLLRVLLSASTAEFETAMKRSADSAKTWSKDLRQVGRQATEVGAALTKTLTLPIAGVGLAASKLAIEFESSFAGVRKTVDGTDAQLAELAQGFRDLSKTIPVNVNDLNRLGESAGALGIPRDKIVEFAAVMAKLGVSTNLTADQAADAIARIQNIFGAAGKDTERLASTLVALGNAGASTEKEIVEMAQRIAGAGHTVGLSQAQVLAYASTLASVGINAEAGGSAISRIFLKMNDAVQKGGAGLAEFARVAGMSSGQFKQAFETDAASAVQAFIEGLGRLKANGENINATIEGLTGKNIILKDTLFRLSGAGQLLGDQLKVANDAWQTNSALSKEAGERFKTTESRLMLLGNTVRDVGITLGNALRPAIDAAINGLNAILPVLDSMARAFAALPGSVQLGIVGFAGLVAAAGPAIYVFGQLALATSALTGAFAAKGLASRVLLADLGFLVTAVRANIVAAAAAVTQYGVLGTASMSVTTALRGVAAAIVAMPFAAATAAAAAFAGALVYLYSRSKEAALAAETQGAKQDAINRAISHGAAATITYAEAVKFNTEWEEKRIAAFNRANRGANSLAEAQAQLTAANAKYAKELAPIKTALEFQIKHMGETGKSVQDLAKEYGISEQTVTRFMVSLQANTGALHANTGATNANTDARSKHVAVTSQMVQVENLLAKAKEHETASLAFATSAWQAWERTVSHALATLRTAPVLLQGRNLSGLVPQIDASGAGNLAGVNTHGSAAGLITQLFGNPGQMGQQLAATIVGAFQGGGNAVQSAVGQLGASVASKFGESLTKDGPKFFAGALGKIFAGALPVVGSLMGPLIGAIGKLFSTEGRDTKLAMAQEAFGSVEAMQREMVARLSKAQYDTLWKQFSEVGQKNKDQAIAAVNAIVAALDAQKAKEDEVAAAAAASAKAQADALDEITAKYKTQIDELDREYKSLSDSVAKEAEEEFMGLTEMKERERMKQIEDEKKALEMQRDAEIAAKKETFAETLEAAQQVDREMRDMFERGYRIPIRFEFPDGVPSASAVSKSYDTGMTAGWESRTPPTALTRASGGGVAQFYADGRLLASMTVPHIPGEVKKLGLNR